ncbi:hypothetical protein JQS43_09615 [Natronosporangium hydrolyticum]|uniref:Uncharacterized protein n=1 Tax=Natronosporangium hydrolyticum TaxID=2811111 RepID=A0A895YMG6_9ACTN|nr:hypothetical protein [Natronosporangium hydrolyticum]QSB16503.1 hypothetical protein JQS43_09615 [Natronosporangium hydrolyticum]
MTQSTWRQWWHDWWSPPVAEPTPTRQLSASSFESRLPSALPGAPFEAWFTVEWYNTTPAEATDHEQLAEAVRAWAAAITARDVPSDVPAVQTRLAQRLAATRSLPGTDLVLVAGSVTLDAPAASRRAALQWEELHRELALDRLRREVERNELRYLREVFTRPEVARSYWLRHHPEALDELLSDRFEQIAERLGQTPEDPQQTIATLLREFLTGLGQEERRYLLDQLAAVFAAFRRSDLGDRLGTVGQMTAAPPTPNGPLAGHT